MTSRIGAAVVILLAASIAAPAFSQARGADIYKAKCAVCHGSDGLAVTPMARIVKTLSFKDPAILKATDAQLFDSTKNGKSTMKGYGGMLTDVQIKDLVAYMRTLQR
ncbi:MAG: cytochrome c [Terracidiphilus sp.]|jgi:mono/diheme cytochrome c family protein